MNFFDEAFKLAKDHSNEKAKELLSRQLNTCKIEEINNAIENAQALIDFAEHCAEMVRQGKLNEPEALDKIKNSHPGFSIETYGFALNHGFFLTR